MNIRTHLLRRGALSGFFLALGLLMLFASIGCQVGSASQQENQEQEEKQSKREGSSVSSDAGQRERMREVYMQPDKKTGPEESDVGLEVPTSERRERETQAQPETSPEKGQVTPPLPLAMHRIASSEGTVCAITVCGQVKCWGRGPALDHPTAIQHNTPAGRFIDLGPKRTAKHLVVGRSESCAFLDDDTVVCWGCNYTELKRPACYSKTKVQRLAFPRRKIKQLAMRGHACALLDNGQLHCWGYGQYGRLGYGNSQSINRPPTLPVNLGSGHTAKHVAVGAWHTCALLGNGTVKCWGSNQYNQLGFNTGRRSVNAPPTQTVDLGAGRKARWIGAGYDHTCAILDDDTLKCWGRNNYGQLGVGLRGDISDRPITSVGLGKKVKQVSLGRDHTCAVLEDGTVKCWGSVWATGYNDNQSTDRPRNTPLDLGKGRKAEQIALGYGFSCAILDDKAVRCWGESPLGGLGFIRPSRNTPKASDISLGQDKCNGQCTDLTVTQKHCGACGRVCAKGQVCRGGTCQRTLKAIAIAGNRNDDGHTCAIDDKEQVICWGVNRALQISANRSLFQHIVPPNASLPLGTKRKARRLFLRSSYTYVLLDDGTIKGWGGNRPPKLLQVGTNKTFRQLSFGGFHNCALFADGRVACWGSNFKGQLGTGDTKSQAITNPKTVDLGAGRTALQVEAGQVHTCVLLDTKQVKCWGEGPLGMKSSIRSLVPTQQTIDFGAGRTVLQLATTDNWACAILDNKSVRCWGSRTGWSRLSSNVPDKPVDFGAGRTVTQLSASHTHMCALLDNGEVRCWGENEYGQLGVPTYSSSFKSEIYRPTTSIYLGWGRRARFIATGFRNSCAILDDGTAKCWGDNRSAQLGYGDKVSRKSPETIPILFP